MTHQALTSEQKPRISQVQSLQIAVVVQHNDTRGAAALHLRHLVCKRQRVVRARYLRTLQTLASCVCFNVKIKIYSHTCVLPENMRSHAHRARMVFPHSLVAIIMCVL